MKSHLSQKLIELKLVEDELISFWKNLWKILSKTILQEQLLKLYISHLWLIIDTIILVYISSLYLFFRISSQLPYLPIYL